MMLRKLAVLFVPLALLVTADALRADDEALAQQAYDVLQSKCFACHGALKVGGLDLRTRESMTTGGGRGAALVPHEPDKSLLYRFASHQAEPMMPPGDKLADAEIDVLRRWILDGASFEGIEAAEVEAGERAAEDQAELAKQEERPITEEERAFWAYQQPKPVKTPDVSNPAWRTNPIDAFLLSSMKENGVVPSPPADRRTLIRRAYLDVLGLPPAPEEVDAFVNDPSPDAWTRLVDRLLASPHYGERWASHWLDLARYADSGGFEFDVDRGDMWRYRDYVVNAFNDDKPYDQFIKEQLAGDEFAPDSDEAMIATGFLRLGPEGGGGGERGRQDSLDDILSTTTLAFLGQTVGCARCHNHKFDPIPQKDYYRMQSIFFNVRRLSHPLVPPDTVAAHEAETKRIEALQKPLQEQKKALEDPYRQRLFDEWLARLPEYMQAAWRTPESERTEGQKLNVKQIEKTLLMDSLSGRINEEQILALMPEAEKQQHAELKAQIADLEKQLPEPFPTARAVEEASREPKPSYFLHRGSIDSKGSLMSPGVLTVAWDGEYDFPAPPQDAHSSWRRRGFAEWIASPENPLTARVMVNRLWQHHFGEGIVRTPSNFGKTGEAPSHPELLDWLALEFIERGWSMKQMHRLMLTSEAYQMASDDIAANLAIDPDNRLFWRMPRQRLEAEVIRDAVLAVAGTLDAKLGGPCIFPYINPDLFQSSTKRTWPGKPDSDPSTWRRSLYVFAKRSIRYPLFETFDQPNLVNSCDRRNRSIIAPQALLLMNNSFVLEHSGRFAERVRQEAGADPQAQIDRAWRLALGRLPLADEKAEALEYLGKSQQGLTGLCHALFNLNEFVYRQ